MSSDLYNQQGSIAAALRERMIAVRASSPAHSGKPASPTADSSDALRSLGYLSGPASSSPIGDHADPKYRIADFEQYSRALALSSSGRLAE
jgi:hypothetical protein